MKLICNGIEKETKYSGGWLDSYGRELIYEEMTTDHLMRKSYRRNMENGS